MEHDILKIIHFVPSSLTINMDWGIKENRTAVIALYKCNKSPSDIFKILKPLKISKKFVHRAIKRYRQLSSLDDRPRSGRPRISRTPAVIKAVGARIRRNPRRKQKIMAREMKISARTMSRIIQEDLHLRAYRRRTGHRLNPKLKSIRMHRSKQLLQRYANGGHHRILFTDEKIFSIEEKFNRQNDRVYAHSSREAAEKVPKVERGHHPASVMVWWGVSFNGVTQLHFCEQGVKTKAKNYQEDILEGVVKPLNQTLFASDSWVFQQDDAPAHKARTTQQCSGFRTMFQSSSQLQNGRLEARTLIFWITNYGIIWRKRPAASLTAIWNL